jgi:inosose dehydratase
MHQNRRNFLKTATALTGSALFVTNQKIIPQAIAQTVHSAGQVEVFINQYTVDTFYSREGINFKEQIDLCFAELKAAGLAGFEASVGQPEELDMYVNALKKQNLLLRSIYASANLHEEAVAAAELKRVVAIAGRAKSAGTKVIVFNPLAKSGKTDAELNRQNQNLNVMGAELRKLGIKLALHYHTPELEFAAREFHSFMCDTDPENVSLCFDTHWSFRGSNNSAVSAYNHAKLYADRIVALHLRQSQGGVWTETFTRNADIDYDKTFAILRQSKSFDDCLVILEQAPEKGTPKTLKPVEIFRQSVEAVKKLY